MTLEPSAFGLDIDQRSVHFVRVVRRFGRVVVTHASTTLLPENPQGHESVIRRFAESLDLTDERCGIAVFGRGVILNTVAMPPQERARERVAEAEIKRLSVLSEEAMASDFSSRRLDTEADKVLIAFVQQQVLGDALAIPDQTGLHVTHVVPIAVAMLRTIQHGFKTSATQIVAHIRSESTHLIMVARGRLLFSRRFDIGSSHFIEAVRNRTSLRGDTAEEACRTVGLIAPTHDNTTDLHVQAAMTATADQWVAELQSTLSLWKERHPQPDSDTETITLSGTAAGIPGFMDYVGMRLNRTVTPIRLAAVPGTTPTTAPAYTVAMGLALASLDRSDRSINLLPHDRRAAIHLQERRRLWLLVAGTLALTLLVVLAGIRWRQHDIARARVLAQGELRPLQSLDEEQARLHGENDVLEARLNNVQSGTGTSRTLQSLIRALGAVKNEDDWVSVIADASTYFSNATNGLPSSDLVTNRAVSTVIVEGYTPRKDFSTVLTMIERLRHEPCVAHADLVADERIPATNPERALWNGLDAALFVIEIELNEP